MRHQQFLLNIFSSQTVWPVWTKFGGRLQKLFTEFDSIKNSGCHGNEIEFFMLKGKSTSFSKCCFSKVQLSIINLVIFLFFKNMS